MIDENQCIMWRIDMPTSRTLEACLSFGPASCPHEIAAATFDLARSSIVSDTGPRVLDEQKFVPLMAAMPMHDLECVRAFVVSYTQS